MKIIGGLFIAVGLALLIFVGFNFFKSQNRILSPIPLDNGVKVIFVTPNK